MISSNYIPVIPVVGINAESKSSLFLKEKMHETFKGTLKNYEIKIMPDKNNPYDENAIMVLFNDFKIGYVSKQDQMYFSFTNRSYYLAHIISWGVLLNNQGIFLYIQPYI